MRRATLLVVLVLVVAWLLPWTEAPTATGVRIESGLGSAGAVAGAALLVLAGLAVTSIAASTRVELRRGAALTEAALALWIGGLLAVAHAWLPRGVPPGPVAAPVFLPLALLALLDAASPRRRVARLRAASGLLAGAMLAWVGAFLPAAAAFWIALAALLLGETTDDAGARRALGMLQLAAAVWAFFAPGLNAALQGREETGLVFLGRYLWQVASLVLMGLALTGLARGRDASEPVPPR